MLTLLSPVHEKVCLEDKQFLREQGDHPTSELGEKLMLHYELYVDTTKLNRRNAAVRCSSALHRSFSSFWFQTACAFPPLLKVFDNTPAALDGTVAAGDEITGVNGKSVKGKTKVEVAKMIQMVKVRGRRGSFWVIVYIVLSINEGKLLSLGSSTAALNLLFLQGEVTIHYNKLQADPKQGKSLDIGKM